MVRHRYPHSRVFVFARAEAERAFARELGAAWAGDTADEAPEKLHSIIDTTPAWTPIVEALKNLEPGGRLVINAIRKEDRDKDALLRLDYPAHLCARRRSRASRTSHGPMSAHSCNSPPRSRSRPRSRNMSWRTPIGRSSR